MQPQENDTFKTQVGSMTWIDQNLPDDLPTEDLPTESSVWHTPDYSGPSPELVDGPFDGIGDFFTDLLGDFGGALGSVGPSIASLIGGWPLALAAVLGFKLIRGWQQKQPTPVSFVTYSAPAGQSQALANYLSASGARVAKVEENGVIVPIYHRGVADRAVATYNGRASASGQITRIGA